MKKMLFVLLFAALCACQSNPDNAAVASYFTDDAPGVKTGGIQIVQIESMGKTFNIWTKRFGNHPDMKLLLLNGGPGATHEYFECMESFLPKEDIEFIYYDQLGCGRSDNPDDTAFWDLARYVEELEQVRKALGLGKDNFYVLGHSWGGILAMEYALKYQDNLKGLIISNMMSSCPDYGKYAEEVLAKQMKPEVLARVRELESKGDFESPEYMDLLYNHFYTAHVLRMPLEQWPEPVNRSFAKLNPSLYVTMQGPSEFGIAGKLEKWDVSSRLEEIKIPALTIGATHDTMDPEHMKWMAGQMPKGTYLHCPDGSHMALYDDQQVYMAGLIQFIKNVHETK